MGALVELVPDARLRPMRRWVVLVKPQLQCGENAALVRWSLGERACAPVDTRCFRCCRRCHCGSVANKPLDGGEHVLLVDTYLLKGSA